MAESILTGELGADICAQLEESGVYEDLTITIAEARGGLPYDPDPGASRTRKCKGVRADFSTDWLRGGDGGGLVEVGDVKVLILGTTLDFEPAPGDHMAIAGCEYLIVRVESDAAGAFDIAYGRRI